MFNRHSNHQKPQKTARKTIQVTKSEADSVKQDQSEAQHPISQLHKDQQKTDHVKKQSDLNSSEKKPVPHKQNQTVSKSAKVSQSKSIKPDAHQAESEGSQTRLSEPKDIQSQKEESNHPVSHQTEPEGLKSAADGLVKDEAGKADSDKDKSSAEPSSKDESAAEPSGKAVSTEVSGKAGSGANGPARNESDGKQSEEQPTQPAEKPADLSSDLRKAASLQDAEETGFSDEQEDLEEESSMEERIAYRHRTRRIKRTVGWSLLILAAGIAGYSIYKYSLTYQPAVLKDMVLVEYGSEPSLQAEDIFESGDYSSIEDLRAAADSIPKNEQGNWDFGTYSVEVSYSQDGNQVRQKLPLVVADTTSPVISVKEEIILPASAQEADYLSYLHIDDADHVTTEINDSAVEYGTPGNYAIMVTATDDSQNKTEQIVSVKITN